MAPRWYPFRTVFAVAWSAFATGGAISASLTCAGYRLAAAPTKACVGDLPLVVAVDADAGRFVEQCADGVNGPQCCTDPDVGRLLEESGRAVAICVYDPATRSFRWDPFAADRGP